MKLRIKSNDLNKLCESLQKISLFEDDLETSDIQKDNKDNKYYVDVNANDTDSAENIVNNIEDTDEISEIDSPEAQKEELKANFINEVKDYLDTADTLKSIISKYNKLKNNNADQQLSDNWELNTKDNDITLPNKGLHIFLQNKNICLSHEGEVEIFNNINELKEYLRKNEYKDVPENLISQLHESSIEKIEKLLLEWGNYPDGMSEYDPRSPEYDDTDDLLYDKLNVQYAVKILPGDYDEYSIDEQTNFYVTAGILKDGIYPIDQIISEDLISKYYDNKNSNGYKDIYTVFFTKELAGQVNDKFNTDYKPYSSKIIEVYGGPDDGFFYEKPEDAVSNYNDYLSEPDYDEYDPFDECCGGACGATTTANIAPAAKYTVLSNEKNESVDLDEMATRFINYRTTMNVNNFKSIVQDMLAKYNSINNGRNIYPDVKIGEISNNGKTILFNKPLNINVVVTGNQFGDEFRVLIDPNAKPFISDTTRSYDANTNTDTTLIGILKWIIKEGNKNVVKEFQEVQALQADLKLSHPKRARTEKDKEEFKNAFYNVTGIMWDGREK